MRHAPSELLAVTSAGLKELEARMAAYEAMPVDVQAQVRAAGGNERGWSVGGGGAGAVAVIPLYGFITQKPSLASALGFGTSAERFADKVVAALRDRSISAVVLDVDSPGGEVFGLPEAARRIRDARGGKPLTAVVNPMAASGAYWLASQADEIVTTPSGLSGSIGVFVAHVDESGALEKEGIRVEVIRHGRRKAEGNPVERLSDEARKDLQARVDYFGALFEADIAAGRRTSLGTVLTRYGEGAVFTAERARAAGLVDSIGTLAEVGARSAAWASARAEIDARRLVAGLPRERPKPQEARTRLEPRAYDPAEIRARRAVAGIPDPETEAKAEIRRRCERAGIPFHWGRS